jgi:hypothetical protein
LLWPRPRSRRLGAALAVAAGLVVTGGLHAGSHADAVVPLLVSLQRFTFFYWDQERYGMLVPLLALPVRDPLWNLLLQRFLLVLSGLVAAALLARHVLAGRDWPMAGALSAGFLLLAAPAPWAFEYLADQPYGLSLGLALTGLALAEPDERGRHAAGQVAAGAVLVLLAHWVNAAAGLLLLPLAAARALLDRSGNELPGGAYPSGVRDRLLVDAGLLGMGVAAAQVGLRLYPAASGRPLRLALGLLPAGEWPSAWARLAANTWRMGQGWFFLLCACAAAGLAFLGLAPHLRREIPRALLRSAALLAAALSYALLAGSLRWVADNGFHWRYLVPSAVLVHVAAVSLLAEPLARSRRLAAPAGAAALALPALAALIAFGLPSLGRVRSDLDRTCGALTAEILEARCDAIAGDYWTVWPAVWHVAWVRHDRGLPGELHGVTHRSNPTLPLWRDRPGARVCVPAGEEAAALRWLSDYGLLGLERVPLGGVGRTGAPWPRVHGPRPAP